MHRLRLNVPALSKRNASDVERALLAVPGVASVDTWAGEAAAEYAHGDVPDLAVAALARAGFEATIVPDRPVSRRAMVRIDGMTCKSCEILVERRFRNVPGISVTDVDSSRGVAKIELEDGTPIPLAELQRSVAADGYRVSAGNEAANGRPSALRLTGAFGIAALILFAVSRVTPSFTDMAEPASFAAAALLGLVAGSSACMAVSGGLMLGIVAEYSARGAGGRGARFAPSALFVAGRIASYAGFGAAIGLAGNALTLTPLSTGILTVVAALFMIVTGLDLLGIAPRWMRVFVPRAPKRWGNAVMDKEQRRGAVVPFLIGAGTFFIPCGYTQALQLVALASGSAAVGAAILGGFAVGTAPALLALGLASAATGGRYGKFALQVMGAAVLILGLGSVRNGLTAAGVAIAIPRVPDVMAQAADPNVRIVDGVQVIRMKIGIDPAYAPSDTYTVRAGSPVRFEIAGVGTGCRSVFQIPRYGVRAELSRALNVVEFVPESPGEAVFSCAMGMFPGLLRVLPAGS